MLLWISVLSVTSGGFVADRTGRPQTILVAAAIASALLMLLFARGDAVIPIVIALGLISGLPRRSDHERAGPRAGARDPRDRHGHFLHRLLCRDDAGAGRRRRGREM